MKFSAFIRQNFEAIAVEWDAFARTLLPSASSMSDHALRDHCKAMLLAICKDMDTRQSEQERSNKSMQMEADDQAPETAAAVHGGLRHLAGFDLLQLVGEFRAMRASVLALWRRSADRTSGDGAIEEIIRFNEAVDQALAESVESYSGYVDSSRDMFLAILGHDLRNPLSAIHMSSLLLSQPGLTEAARLQASVRIGRACKAMTGLITDLLEFTRSRLGPGIPIERTPCNLHTICEESIESMRAEHPEIRFELQASDDLEFNGDAPRLRQVLSNLLSNAVQHGDRKAPIVVVARGDSAHIVLEVANKGRPIRPEKLQVIFEPLVQAAEARSQEVDERSSTSLGLGLYIVREIVVGHGGEVIALSSAQGDIVFRITLPRTV